MASAAGVAGVRATLDSGSKSSQCVHCGELDSARITGNPVVCLWISTEKLRSQVSIHRQSRWLYGCWPLKGAFSQPSEAKARTKAKTSYCYLHCHSTGNSREDTLPEFSKFYCHPGKALSITHKFSTDADAELNINEAS
jgi:hypothetical protein